MKRKKPSSEICTNKKGLFDHEVIEEHEAGIQLLGWEVKSMRNGSCQLKGSHVTVHHGHAQILGMHVSPYKSSQELDIATKRIRPLLLKKSTILRLEQKTHSEGMTLIPTRVYWKGNLVKVSVALARGRKKYDKRELIKKRDNDRAVAKVLGRKI